MNVAEEPVKCNAKPKTESFKPNNQELYGVHTARNHAIVQEVYGLQKIKKS